MKNIFKAKLSFIAIVAVAGSILMSGSQCFAGEEVSLFDGKTLNGWEKNTKVFSVVDGEIIGDSTVRDAGFVIFMKHEKDYKDFTLKLKVKMDKLQDGLVNSGIMIRSDYEVDIGQWGGLFSATAAKFLSTPSAVEINKFVKQGDWNDMEITCQGPRFVIKVNGVTTVDWIETDPKA
ncbi:MAG: 3-keto-disaccharide hydrolase, partial [Planctomycetota bacterium]